MLLEVKACRQQCHGRCYVYLEAESAKVRIITPLFQNVTLTEVFSPAPYAFKSSLNQNN